MMVPTSLRAVRSFQGSGLLALSLVAAAVLALSASAAEARPGVGDRAPELIAVKDDQGRKVRLRAHYKKGWVVMTIGGSWCKPCRKELPAWDKLAAELKPRGVTFVAINADAKIADGKAFMNERGIKHMVRGYDPDQSSIGLWDPEHMPTTYVIDCKGIIRYVHAAYQSGDEDTLAKAIEALIK